MGNAWIAGERSRGTRGTRERETVEHARVHREQSAALAPDQLRCLTCRIGVADKGDDRRLSWRRRRGAERVDGCRRGRRGSAGEREDYRSKER